jgi:hypothetical protein
MNFALRIISFILQRVIADGFIFLSKEDILWLFMTLKILRPRTGLNPQALGTMESMLPREFTLYGSVLKSIAGVAHVRKAANKIRMTLILLILLNK